MTSSPAPSLLNTLHASPARQDNARVAHTLVDLLYDGFYALFLLKNRCFPKDGADFAVKVQKFLHDFERQAKKLDVMPDDIHAAKYAFCAAVDEIILKSQSQIRPNWERHPLQLLIFGDQLAGENFFVRLEELRLKGASHVQALEVFHLCLLLGFQGKYLIEGTEKLSYLTARLGDEIAQMKGKSAGFAPHWRRPDHIINKLRSDVPLWVICSVLALIGAAGYAGIDRSLTHQTNLSIQGYSDIVRLAPRAAHITITLP